MRFAQQQMQDQAWAAQKEANTAAASIRQQPVPLAAPAAHFKAAPAAFTANITAYAAERLRVEQPEGSKGNI